MTGDLRSSSSCGVLSGSGKQDAKATVTVRTGDGGDSGQGDAVEVTRAFGRRVEEGVSARGWAGFSEHREHRADGEPRTRPGRLVGGVRPRGG